MEYRKISAKSTSTLLTLQDKEGSPSIRNQPPSLELMDKIQKLNELQNLLRHVYKQQDQLKIKNANLQEELISKQEQVKQFMNRQNSIVQIEQLEFTGQNQSEDSFEINNYIQQKCFQRTKKHQFYSAFPSPRQYSPQIINAFTKTSHMRTPNFSPEKNTSKFGLIRKQSQKCFTKETNFTNRPIIKNLGHLKTISYGYSSIDDLWNQCPPTRPYAD